MSFGNRVLVDALPALDPVGAARIGQALARPLAHLVGIVGEQDVAGREIGGVLIEDVHREFPPERHEASHLGPCAVGNEQRVGSDVERRRRAEFAAPQTDGAHVLEIFIQHVRHHAQHVRKFAVRDLVLEIADDDRARSSAHDTDCFAPIRRNRAGMVARVDHAARECRVDQLERLLGQRGSGKASWFRASSTL